MPPLNTPAHVVADGLRRFGAEPGETRPVIEIDEHRLVRRPQRHVAAENVEPQQLGGPECQALERRYIDGLLVISTIGEIPPEKPVPGDPVELDDRAGNVLL